jgi:hypothetical protein
MRLVKVFKLDVQLLRLFAPPYMLVASAPSSVAEEMKKMVRNFMLLILMSNSSNIDTVSFRDELLIR